MCMFSGYLISTGRLFQSASAEVSMMLLPVKIVICLRGTNGGVDADRSGEYQCNNSDKYTGTLPRRNMYVVTNNLNSHLLLIGSQCSILNVTVRWL